MFNVTASQAKEAEIFIKMHSCSLEDDPLGGKKAGAIGGQISWCFTPTSLGEILVVKCLCGARANLTEFNDW